MEKKCAMYKYLNGKQPKKTMQKTFARQLQHMKSMTIFFSIYSFDHNFRYSIILQENE